MPQQPRLAWVLTRALWVFRNVPRMLLQTLLDRGKFGIPHLYTHMCQRHVRGFLRTIESQSVIIRKNVIALRSNSTSEHNTAQHSTAQHSSAKHSRAHPKPFCLRILFSLFEVPCRRQ